MLFAFAFSFFYLIIAAYINITWIHEIAAYFNYPFAIFLVVFIALIPGFIYVFTLISILVNKRTREKSVNKDYDVTVLIPVYNAEDSIKKTLDSIINQKYEGKINIIVIDDGSSDNSIELLKKENYSTNVMILEMPHKGKSYALNEGLQHVTTEYVITVDSDTSLQPLAIQAIMNKLVNSSQDVAATAGAIFVQNDRKNFVTKLQQYGIIQ